ncbi:MAG: transcription termination factor NusA [Gemmatimonadota bacterium]|nr:transcription termination factor NusA [Gemmatimonadota bacterium]MDH4348154.1 transcription termination factor NusA [Gemmatimonadota bacterium]MDH5283931.1 transcription termination factor NusA [Gemmatimonadota bacterium]
MSGSAEVLGAIRELTTSKQLDRTELVALLRDGIEAALMRRFGPTVKFELDFDDLKGTMRVIRLRQVVETVEDPACQISLEEARYEDEAFALGDQLEEEVPFAAFGRLAVQAAKQRIIQRVREGERTRIREEFASKVGELLSGEVQQIERGKLVIMLNRFKEAEAIIPYREQNHREKFHQGDTIRSVLKKLEETPKGPRLILSRGDPLFVKALFKLEVPEIQQGIVEIRAWAREVGSRTKIAVISRDDAIDPVGACVGLKGSRVQAVVNELGGERIDIVPWSPDPERFARLALAPARVAKVFSDPATKTIQAVVDEDQLSLAIGRNGQNVRLASELTGWKIDLYSSREWLERGGEGPLFAPLPPEDEAVMRLPLSELQGLSPELLAILNAAGYQTLRDVLDLEREDIERIDGMTPERTEQLVAFLAELTEEGGSDAAPSE